MLEGWRASLSTTCGYGFLPDVSASIDRRTIGAFPGRSQSRHREQTSSEGGSSVLQQALENIGPEVGPPLIGAEPRHYFGRPSIGSHPTLAHRAIRRREG